MDVYVWNIQKLTSSLPEPWEEVVVSCGLGIALEVEVLCLSDTVGTGVVKVVGVVEVTVVVLSNVSEIGIILFVVYS